MARLLLALLLAGCAAEPAPLGLPSHLTLSVVEGGPDPSPVALALENTGTCDLDYTVATSTVDGGAWLSTGPGDTVAASGTGTLSIATAAGAEGLAPDVWTGTVAVAASCADTGQPAVGSPVDISVNVTVVPSADWWPVSGGVTGLAGAGLELEEVGTGDYVTMGADGPFGFAVPDGDAFDVVVSQQPISPEQVCTVSGGSGVVNGGPVSGVQVTCTTECVSDAFEPNNLEFEAAELSPGFHSLSWCDSEDWFQVPTAPWLQLTVEATFDHDEGNIDLFALGPFQTTLDQSTGSGDSETLEFVSEGGPGIVQVTMTDNGEQPGNTYDLEVSRDCIVDPTEPNESPTAAVPLTLPHSSYNALCSGDADWFAFDVTQGDLFDVIVQASFGEGTVGMELQDLDGNTLSTGTPDGYLSYAVTTTETVRLGITLDADVGEFEGTGYFLDVFL